MPILVNNEPIDDELIREEARSIRPRLNEAMQGQDPAVIEAQVRKWARENIVERVVLRQAALADPEPLAPEVIEKALGELQDPAPGQAGCRTALDNPALRDEVDLRLRIERLFSRATAHLAPPRNKDITEFYRKNRENLRAPERVHAAHIVKNVDERINEATARAAIEDVQNRLRGGAVFEELADQYSDCPGRGGDLGTFIRGAMVPEFDEVVFGMAPGQVSDIFQTSFGFHIAKVYERKPESVPELQEIRGDLEKTLFEQKKQRAIEQFLDRLLAKADVREA